MRIKLLLAASLLTCLTAHAKLEVHPFFNDHMVLQRDQMLPVWGSATPGAEVTVSFRRSEASTEANAAGDWMVKLPEQKVGSASSLTIQSNGEVIEFEDVLVGEVWVCSGQSNMQWRVDRSMNPEAEVAAADYPMIRLFEVPEKYSIEPQSDVDAEWVLCSPETIASFSAVGYYFGRELWQELGVPIGLVSSNWGGTPAESWTPLEALKSRPDYSELVSGYGEASAMLQNNPDIGATMQANFDAFNERIDAISSNIVEPQASSFDPDLTMPDAVSVEPGVRFLDETDGMVHVRKVFNLSEAQASLEGAQINLGQIDNFDVTWINGVRIGETLAGGPAPRRQFREYPIPENTLKAGANVVLIQIVDIRNTAHFGYNIETPEIVWAGGQRLGLTEDWSMQLVADAGKRPSNLDAKMRDIGSFLWNAMIHPLKPAPFRGVIWYQGESNTGRGEQYQKLFPDMIQAWRDEWGRDDFPFYFVQLANFSGQDGWPELREAQLMTLDLPNTGMAVAIDIGDKDDIHPKNKQEVGRRLSLWALAETYGATQPSNALGRIPLLGKLFQEPIPFSGPLFDEAEFENDKVEIEFDHVYDGLRTSDGGPLRGFEIAGEDGVFRPAFAEIDDGDEVELSHPDIENPTAVRYAWDINPDANLVNSAGLPASPFRVE
jgi:sialate O-acetylesterase